MKKEKRQPWLDLLQQTVDRGMSQLFCDWCKHSQAEWDGDEYKTYCYPICSHPLPAVNESNASPCNDDWYGQVQDCWGFRPALTVAEVEASLPTFKGIQVWHPHYQWKKEHDATKTF